MSSMAKAIHYKFLGDEDNPDPFCESIQVNAQYLESMHKVSLSKLPETFCKKCLALLKKQKLNKA